MESEESETQTSVCAETTVNEDHDEYELSDIHTYLTNKFGKLRDSLDKYHSLEDNNPEISMTEDPHSLLKYQMQLLNCLIQELKHLNPQEWTRYSAHIQMDLMASLNKEVQDVSTLLQRCSSRLEEDKKELADLKEKVKYLKDMFEERQKNPEVHQGDSLLPMQKKLSLEYNTHRIKLHDMIEKLYREDGDVLSNFLQEITRAYFDDEIGEPYVTVEGNYHCIEMLLEADIITRHPYDFKKFRLTDFLH